MKMFPVLRYYGKDTPADCPTSIPWAMLSPHEAQAMKNHSGQTLARLAERGGMSAGEIMSVLEDRDLNWGTINRQLDVDELNRRVAAFKESSGLPAAAFQTLSGTHC